MPRQLWLLDILADEFRGSRGFRVDYYPGWESRGSSLFDPTHVMDHHTGAGAYNNLLRYMAVGPVHPPLCNIATSRPSNGVVRITVVAAGRANHAGRGNYSTIPQNQGNRYCIGRENQNDGRQSWPDQQLEAIRRCDKAELIYLKRSTDRLLDHKTYAPARKVDRHSISIHNERRIVGELMRSPTDPLEAFMASLSSDQKEILTRLSRMSSDEASVVLSFADYLAHKAPDRSTGNPVGGVAGHSFARQTLGFLREDLGQLRTMFNEIDRLDSSPLGFARWGVAVIRAARKHGWDPDMRKELGL